MALTPSSLLTISFLSMMAELKEIVTDFKVDEDETKMYDQLLTKLPADYSFVINLASHARHYARQFKRQGPDYKMAYEDMVDKKNALEDLAGAIKLQYQGVSRRITVKTNITDELSMFDYRKGE